MFIQRTNNCVPRMHSANATQLQLCFTLTYRELKTVMLDLIRKGLTESQIYNKLRITNLCINSKAATENE